MFCKVLLRFTFLFSFAFSQSASATLLRIEKFVVVVPVYRELYNQNIAALLLALYDQDLSGLGFEKIDVWLNVNNDASISSEIRLENQKTLELLKDLQDGKSTASLPEGLILRKLSETPIAKRLSLHIIDQTTPGNRERNIGKVRDFAAREAIRELSDKQAERVIVAQTDADATFAPGYAKSIVKTFENRPMKFALLDMSYADQRDSEPRVYQRKILSDFQIAAHNFRLSRDGGMPSGGSPRIVTTAKALRSIGGVPHLTFGEDTELITRLKATYAGAGQFLDVGVKAGFRAREDGYDAAIYHRALAEPIVFTPWMLESAELLPETEKYLIHTLGLGDFFREALRQILKEHHSEVSRRRGFVRQMLADFRAGRVPADRLTDFPAILENSWLRERLIQSAPHDEAATLRALALEFPYYFGVPAPPEILTIAKMRAATQTFLNRAFLENPVPAFALAVDFANRYPETGRKIVDRRLSEIEASWTAALEDESVSDSIFQKLKPFLSDYQNLRELSRIEELSDLKFRSRRLADLMEHDVFKMIEINPRFFLGRTSELLEFTQGMGLKIPERIVRALISANPQSGRPFEIRFLSEMARLNDSNPTRYEIYHLIRPLLQSSDEDSILSQKNREIEKFLLSGVQCSEMFKAVSN